MLSISIPSHLIGIHLGGCVPQVQSAHPPRQPPAGTPRPAPGLHHVLAPPIPRGAEPIPLLNFGCQLWGLGSELGLSEDGDI